MTARTPRPALRYSFLPSVVFLLAVNVHGMCRAQQPQPIPVRHVAGTGHAFFTLRAESGAVLGYAEALQVVHGDRVLSHLTYHFRDGSIDDEDAVFTQHTAFHLIRDHHIQRGPFFSKAIDCLIEQSGDVTLRTVDKDGKEKLETSHIDLPSNIANGFTGTLLLNSSLNSGPFKLSLIAPAGKPRLIQLSIEAIEKQHYLPVPGARRPVTVLRIHPELGGVAGVVAPVIGKQPKDIFVWIFESPAPALVREIGPLEQGGPVISVEPAGASYPPAIVDSR